jgi:hypothetical protein
LVCWTAVPVEARIWARKSGDSTVMFDTFPETRWLANLIGISSPDPPGADAEVEPAG